MSGPDPLASATALVRAAGYPGAAVEAAGHDRSIAVITGVPAAAAPALAGIAPEVKALGFRYVTIDITTPAP